MIMETLELVRHPAAFFLKETHLLHLSVLHFVHLAALCYANLVFIQAGLLSLLVGIYKL